MLKDLWLDDQKIPKPHLDETKIEDMEILLSESMAKPILLEIITWKNVFLRHVFNFSFFIEFY